MSILESCRDLFEIVKKIDNIELYEKIIALSAQAIEMQNEINRLSEENAELKKRKELTQRIIRHKQPYITLNDDADELKFCAVCWDDENKLMQMKMLRCDEVYCKKCKNRCNLDKIMF